MKKETTQLYEGMYILNASLSEDARNKAFEKIQNGITEKGGEIHKIHEMGRRKLSYTINKRKEGYYYLVFFSLKTSSVQELWKEYQLHEDLLRFNTQTAEKVQEEISHKELAEVS